MSEYLQSYFPPAWAEAAAALVAAGLVVGFIGVAALLYIWAERKVSGRIQDRLGPTRVGPCGLLQSLADGIKLISKEDFAPDLADRWLFHIAPYLAFCSTFTAFILLPFATRIVAWDCSIAVFFILAILSGEVFGILLAGFASGSKWSLYGGIREAAQVVSYEVPRSLCVLVPISVAGTLSLTEFAQRQEGYFWNWTVFNDPFSYITFLLFFVVATAGCKRAPFDLAEAESELVGGFHTEYSGIRWSYFFMAEYGSMFATSGLAVLLFLGGWHPGLIPQPLTDLLGVWFGSVLEASIFIAKSSALVLVMMWLRWSLPRLRIDQVMTTCLKYFIPLSALLLLGASLWLLLAPTVLLVNMKYALAWGSVIAALGLALSLLRPGNFAPRGKLPGAFVQAGELR